MTSARTCLPVFAILVWSVGCHRSLQIGEPMYVDGGVADVPPSPPWYVRNEAYLGPELRLPVPEQRELVGGSILDEPGGHDPSCVRLRTCNNLTASAPDDGHLLVASGNRFLSYEMTPAGPRLETPRALPIADRPAFLLAERRTVVFWGGGETLTRELGHAPTWVTGRGAVYDDEAVFPDVQTMVHATASDGSSLLSIHRRRDTQRETLVRVERAASTAADISGARGAYSGITHTLFSDMGMWHRVTFDDHEIAIQPLRSPLGRSFVDGPEPLWGASLMRTPFPSPSTGTRTEIAVAVADGVVAVIYRGTNAQVFARMGSLRDVQWFGDWTMIGTSSREVAALWDPSGQRFAVALTSGAGMYPRGHQLLTQFVFLSRTGNVLPSTAPTRPLAEIKLVNWQQQLWAIGIDEQGTLVLFQPDRPQPSVSYRQPGSQRIDSALNVGSSVLASWSDAQNSYVTRLTFDQRLTAQSAHILPRRGGRLSRDSSGPTYLAARREWGDFEPRSPSGEIVGPFGGAIARIDDESLAVVAQRGLDDDELVQHVHATSGSLLVLSSRNFLPLGTPTESRASLYDSMLRPLRVEPVAPISVSEFPNCVGLRCVIKLPEAGPSDRRHRLIDLGSSPLREEPWRSSDLASFPTCEAIPNTYSHSVGVAPRTMEDGDCTAPTFRRLPGVDVDHACEIDEDHPGEYCDVPFDAFAGSASHTLVLEAHGDSLGGQFQSRRSLLRLFGRGSNDEIASIAVSSPDLSGSVRDRTSTRLFHVDGGMFVLLYTRSNAYRGTNEAYARIVYFPEAETVSP